jgi:histidyl-tRNA synthetase
MKRANRLNAARVLIVGDNELAAGEVVLRDMKTKAQRMVPIEGLVKTIEKTIRADRKQR